MTLSTALQSLRIAIIEHPRGGLHLRPHAASFRTMDGKLDLQVNKKAFQVNMDGRIYGAFAEIGAGQETARRFFHVDAVPPSHPRRHRPRPPRR